VPPKHWYVFNSLHVFTSQRTLFSIVTKVDTLNLTFVYAFTLFLSSNFFSFSFLFLLIEGEFVSVQAMKPYGDLGDDTKTLDGRT